MHESIAFDASPAVVTPTPLVPFVYAEIPLGNITPNGWLRAEMETEANGLAGHLYDFYSFVHDATWLGGSAEYSNLNEAFPYWLNGIVPLAYTLNDQRLKDQVHEAMDYLFAHMIADDGWIGPEQGGMRLLWARTLIFFAWTNLVEANKTYEEPVVTAMHDFNLLMHSMLKNNGTGLVEQENSEIDGGYFFWFLSRVAEMIVSLQWLYDKYPRGQEQILRENMQMLHEYGWKWEAWFTNSSYAFDDLYNLPDQFSDDHFHFLHGVNVGEGLKAPAVIRRFTYNDSLVQTTRDGVQWTMKYHGAPSGTILADEREDGVSPWYGSELCTAVEVMFSQSYNFRALGESFYADGSELAAYNALPGGMTDDWWAHVYVSQPNQPYAKNLTWSPFSNTDTMSQTYGLEPDYPCCTVNHPQGLPKFAQAAFVTLGDNGLVHALLSPVSVTTTIGGGLITVECITNYPFEDVLVYKIQAQKSFDLYIRQPTWATKATLSNENAMKESTYDDTTGLHKTSISSGLSTVVYTIETSIRTEPRANDTIAVYRGALLYAFEVAAEISSTGPHNYRNKTLYRSDYAPSQAKDYIMLNATEWNIAIDPSTLVYHHPPSRRESGLKTHQIAKEDPRGSQLPLLGGGGGGDDNDMMTIGTIEPLPTPIFASGNPPMYMTVRACLIDWPLLNGTVPGWPSALSERKCLGDVFDAKLVPYGSAKLRMSELPVIDLKGM